MTVYAGDHGGCSSCDSLGYELAESGHRKGCGSMYANEPPRPAKWRAQKRRDEAKKLRLRAAELDVEADDLEKLE